MKDGMYIPTIGLEIHAELKTNTKMFCDSRNDSNETRPNVNVCHVCIGHPGTLPVINKEAIKHVLKVGVAIGGTLADKTSFDRKNYFYPDIPKGYQISQYKHPLVSGGSVNGIAITRVHLEEDTGISLHNKGNYSLLDFNRAGIPLMELVTEPVMHSAKDAVSFAQELQLLFRYLGASDANMEKGEMRIEANVSIRQNSKVKLQELGTKVEVKNLNSFRAAERAIEYEVKRQSELLENGEAVTQETRGWDDNKQATFSQRLKEESHDYRYFPEPDLPVLDISSIPAFSVEALKKEILELPSERRARYQRIGEGKSSMDPRHIEMFVSDNLFGKLFDDTINIQPLSYNLIANFISTDVAGLVSKYGENGLKNITPEGLSVIVVNYGKEDLSSRGAKDTLEDLFLNGGDASEVCKKYLQKSDSEELAKIIQEVMRENASAVNDYKKGKESALQFLVGQGMKATRGAGNPQVFMSLFLEALK